MEFCSWRAGQCGWIISNFESSRIGSITLQFWQHPQISQRPISFRQHEPRGFLGSGPAKHELVEMKNKYIILFCMIMLLTIGLLLLLHHAEPGTAPLPQESHANTSVTDNPVTYIEAPEADAPVSASQVRADLAMAMARPPATEDKIRALVEGQNVPFNFYGRVIDQDSNSLAGVKLKLSARHWSTTSTGSLRLEKSTDADGRFDVHGITGDVFDLEEVTRDGYELEPYSKHTYGAVGGSVSDPVIFKMWSTNI